MNVDPQPGKVPEPGRGHDDLETLLKRQRFRGLPSDWRAAILDGVAVHANPAVAAAEASSARMLTGVRDFWLSGWTLVAAAWALVFLLHGQFTPVQDHARPPLPPLSAAALAELEAQRLTLAEIST